jgi:hypothetical protein
MQYQVNWARHMHEVGDVALDQPKPWLAEQVGDVGWDTGEEVVQTDHPYPTAK